MCLDPARVNQALISVMQGHGQYASKFLLFCLGVLQVLFNISTALHNCLSSGSLLKNLDGQMIINNL